MLEQTRSELCGGGGVAGHQFSLQIMSLFRSIFHWCFDALFLDVSASFSTFLDGYSDELHTLLSHMN